jgi:selenocysteine lyase/cysteine desulfurase
MNPAGPLHAEIAALAGVGEYIESIHARHFDPSDSTPHEKGVRVFDLFTAHETRLANRVLQTLGDIPGVRIIGQTRARVGRRAATISFVAANRKPGDIAGHLARRNVAVRNGHFYALRCLEALGVSDPKEDGVIRISLVHYNSQEDVDRLVEGLQEIW